MSFFITDYEIDKIIEEDINPIDLTSILLGMKKESARISYIPRTDLVVCCCEEVERIFYKLGLEVEYYKPSGAKCSAGETFFTAKGRADKIHLAWRNGLRMFESFCGISNRTAQFVEIAKKANPDINIVTTRKCTPGAKKLIVKAIMAGGAYPHRLGLSETVLIFGPHINLYGGEEKLLADFPEIKKQAKEKKIGIEAHNYQNAINFVKAGFDFIQLDKFPPEDVGKFVREAKRINENSVIVAAGNIVLANVEEYAKTGADALVTSSLYFGPPADIKAEIVKL